MLASIIALGPFAIDAYLPAIPDIADTFGVEAARVESSVSVFLIFFALGQLLGGPIADRRGRRALSLFGMAGFALASLLIAFCADYTQFLVLRVAQAFCGGLAIVACLSVPRDAFSGRELGRFLSTITSIMLIAPIVAPLIGSGILLALDWRWVFGMMAAHALITLVWSWVRLDETLDPQSNPGSVRASCNRVLGDRHSLLLLVFSGLTMSVMFTFLISSSSIYQELFGVSPQVYSLLFAANVAALLLLTRLNVFLLRRFSMRRMMGVGMTLQLVASLGLLVHSQADAPLWLFVMLVMAAVGCMGIVLPNAVSALMTLHPRDAGACNALGGLVRFVMGGALGAVPTLFVNQGSTPMALTMTILAILGMGCWMLLPRDESALAAQGQG